MVTYREATPLDAEGVAYVLKDCYNIDSLKEAKTVFAEERGKSYHYLVAVDEGIIVGLTTWQIHGLLKHGLCELDRIAVLSSHRGKGVARGLLDALIIAAGKRYADSGHRLRKLYLLTHADNERAQAFYTKMGMLHEATLKKHYYDAKDEWVFSRFFDKV